VKVQDREEEKEMKEYRTQEEDYDVYVIGTCNGCGKEIECAVSVLDLEMMGEDIPSSFNGLCPECEEENEACDEEDKGHFNPGGPSDPNPGGAFP
jgi:hypothetical protein